MTEQTTLPFKPLTTEENKSPSPAEEPKRTLTVPSPPKRIKDPKRVAQGKRLSEISRQAKLAKKEKFSTEKPSSGGGPNLTQVGAVVGIGVGMATILQIMYNFNAREVVPQEDNLRKKTIEDLPSPPLTPPKQLKKLDSEL